MNKKSMFIILGLLIIILLFLSIELSSPYNFTKDDNYAQFLPSIIEGFNQLFSGNFPSINFHQFTGTKLFETGTYAFFYPPLALSYLFSHYFFSNDFLTFEIFALISLILGFLACFYFIYSKTQSELSSLLASLAFIFSGYVLIASANWYYVFPTIVFLPLLLLLQDKIMASDSKKYVFILGLVRGIYFYSGNAQYFAFTLIFEFLYFLFFFKKDFIKKFEKYFLSMILTLVIAMPLLFSQLGVVKDSPRGSSSLLGYFTSLPAMPHEYFLGSLFIYPLVKSSNYFSYSSSLFIDIYYSGTIFFLLFILGGVYLLKKYKLKSFSKINPLFWLAVISILLSFGYFGLIYSFGAFLPIIKSFSSPFKLTIFSLFFTISFGAIIFSRLLEKIKHKKLLKILLVLVLVFFFIMLFYHIIISTKVAWSYYGDSLPLNTHEFDSLNLTGRTISVFTNSSLNPALIRYSTYSINFPAARFLSQNFASYYGIDSIAGYEPFWNKLTAEKIPLSRFGATNQLNLSTLREYAVKYIFMPSDTLSSHPELANLNQIYEKNNLTILELDNSKDYVFADSGLNYSVKGSKINAKIYLNSDENITFNFLYKKEYIIAINNILTKPSQDSFGRIVIPAHFGENKITFYYFQENLFYGCIASFILLFFLAIYLLFRNKLISMKIKIKLNLIKKHKKVIIIIFIVLAILIFAFLLKSAVFNPENIESIIKSRTNLDLSISSISSNLFTGKIILSNVSTENFHSEKIILELSILNTLKETIKAKKPQIIFNKVTISNLSYFINQKPSSLTCNKFLQISAFSEEQLKDNLTNELLVITGLKFIPFNKAYLSFNDSNFKLNNYLTNININLAVEKDISGFIILGQGYSESRCLSFPIESSNPFFV